jgi:hypothetical protein
MSPPPANTAMPLPPPADAALPPAGVLTTPQRPSMVVSLVTTMQTPVTPATPTSTSPSPVEEVFFEVGNILPGWKHVFILCNRL